MINSGDFCKYDYGRDENLKRYVQAFPPNYSLDKIQIPVTLMWGLNDWLADPKVIVNNIISHHKWQKIYYHLICFSFSGCSISDTELASAQIFLSSALQEMEPRWLFVGFGGRKIHFSANLAFAREGVEGTPPRGDEKSSNIPANISYLYNTWKRNFVSLNLRNTLKSTLRINFRMKSLYY